MHDTRPTFRLAARRLHLGDGGGLSPLVGVPIVVSRDHIEGKRMGIEGVACRYCDRTVILARLPARVGNAGPESTWILLDPTPTTCTSGFVLVDGRPPVFIPAGKTSVSYEPHFPHCWKAVQRGDGSWLREYGWAVPTAP